MRKNILSLSIATMIGGLGLINAANANVIVPTTAGVTSLGNAASLASISSATGLTLAPGGIGHQLITPYFTAQGGNATVLSIVNTDPNNGKAVKVRFRSGSNSDDILDFQVYMSPNDHWSALISKNATTGLAQLTTNDNTCTLPALSPGVAQSFITGRLPSYSTATELANLTSEGYVEMFNMADIPKNTLTTSTLYSTILHSAGKPACNTGVLGNLFNDVTVESTAQALGFAAPTTGLFGNWTVINVAQTTTFSGSMTAVRAVVGSTGTDGYGNFVLFPQTSVGATLVDNATADPLFRSVSYKSVTAAGITASSSAGPIAAANYDLPDMSTPYTGAQGSTAPLYQAGRITSALAVSSISNEYSTDPSVNASTDWTFSMPTRRYSVAMGYGTSSSTGTRLYSTVGSYQYAGTAVGPAPDVGTQFFNDGNVTASGDRLCVGASSQSFFDREEGSKAAGSYVFSPGNVTVFRFCGENSVTTFGSNASVLGATLAVQSTGASSFSSGWGMIATPNTSNAINVGLPIMGAAFIKLNNPSVSAGVAGNYGITSDHRFVGAR
jgi:hypothetical protein